MIRTLAVWAWLALLVLSVHGPEARAAGVVEVRFIEPERYRDIGFGQADRQRNLGILAAHMAAWAERLPTGQQLQVDVLDVDLAGELRPVGQDPMVRVMNGRVDSPRIKLRWTLRQGDQVLQGGDDELADLGYLLRLNGRRSAEPLMHDRRLLDRWLFDRVLAGQPAAAR